MEKKRTSKFRCRIIGHKYKPWECQIRHEIDGLYSVTSKCCRCGFVRMDIVPITVDSWNDRIKEVRKYDGKEVDD